MQIRVRPVRRIWQVGAGQRDTRRRRARAVVMRRGRAPRRPGAVKARRHHCRIHHRQHTQSHQQPASERRPNAASAAVDRKAPPTRSGDHRDGAEYTHDGAAHTCKVYRPPRTPPPETVRIPADRIRNRHRGREQHAVVRDVICHRRGEGSEKRAVGGRRHGWRARAAVRRSS